MNSHVVTLACAAALAASLGGPACSGHNRNTTVSKETACVDPTGVREPEVVERQTIETQESEHSGGILSTTVGLVGDIIALPFRLTAGLVKVIF